MTLYLRVDALTIDETRFNDRNQIETRVGAMGNWAVVLATRKTWPERESPK